MSDKETLVNCGECVHYSPHDQEADCQVMFSEHNNASMLGPHKCDKFDPSPLARIASVLEWMAHAVDVSGVKFDIKAPPKYNWDMFDQCD